MPYDPDTGLVYQETIVQKSRNPTSTLTRCLGSRPRYCPPEEGAESLASASMRKLLCNLEMLDADSLGTVPLIVLEKLWKAITRS